MQDFAREGRTCGQSRAFGKASVMTFEEIARLCVGVDRWRWGYQLQFAAYAVTSPGGVAVAHVSTGRCQKQLGGMRRLVGKHFTLGCGKKQEGRACLNPSSK